MKSRDIIRKDVHIPLILFLIAVVTRIPFTSKLFFHSDSINFALALRKYDVTLHQPHPPGYFLYIMFGRLLNLFVADTNMTFVSISILFSGLTVVAIYYLGRELFGRKIGIFAATLAIASPNLWFHGEVALTYVIEAFFSTLTAFLCWKTYQGEKRYAWMTAIVLGIAGGIRQNTPVFLFPLWLFSMKGLPARRFAAYLALFAVTSMSWFIPMVRMTGGWSAYAGAFQELWLFNTGHNSVLEAGWPALRLYSMTLLGFIAYGLGAGILVLSLAAYVLARRKMTSTVDRRKTLFLSIWILPSVLFHLLIFIHPANPGYALLFLPALLVINAATIGDVSRELQRITCRDLRTPILALIIVVNTSIFLFARLPISYPEIKDHDRYLASLIDDLKTFNPATSAIFLKPYIYYGTRHVMYYLPQYRVYEVDRTVAKTGAIRKIFWGMNGQTCISDEIAIPKEITTFVTPFKENDKKNAKYIRGLSVVQSFPSSYPFPFTASGPIGLVKEIYPELRLKPPTGVETYGPAR